MKLSEIYTRDHLAAVVGLPTAELDSLLVTPLSLFYSELPIPKRGRHRRGEYRILQIPKHPVRICQRNLLPVIGASYFPPDPVQGFASKRSIVTNAARHLGKAQILHADIENFFDSITSTQVRAAIVALACVPAVADDITQLCTLNGVLPQGASTSPILANAACAGLDASLDSLANSLGCTYTRYADNITISGQAVPTGSVVAEILKAHGFHLRRDGCRIQRQGRTQFVTGLCVADVARPRYARRLKRRLRLILHYIEKYGWESHLQRTNRTDDSYAARKLEGELAFLKSVEPDLARKYFAVLRKALNAKAD